MKQILSGTQPEQKKNKGNLGANRFPSSLPWRRKAPRVEKTPAVPKGTRPRPRFSLNLGKRTLGRAIGPDQKTRKEWKWRSITSIPERGKRRGGREGNHRPKTRWQARAFEKKRRGNLVKKASGEEKGGQKENNDEGGKNRGGKLPRRGG